MTGFRIMPTAITLLLVFGSSGCIGGGHKVLRNEFSKYPVVAVYKAPEASYAFSLVTTPKGQAILELENDADKGYLYECCWQSSQGKHYALWFEVANQDALARELILDPSGQKLEVLDYESGQYSIVESGERKRIIGQPSSRFTFERVVEALN